MTGIEAKALRMSCAVIFQYFSVGKNIEITSVAFLAPPHFLLIFKKAKWKTSFHLTFLNITEKNQEVKG